VPAIWSRCKWVAQCALTVPYAPIPEKPDACYFLRSRDPVVLLPVAAGEMESLPGE